MIIYSREKVPVVVDTTPILEVGDTVSDPVSYLHRVDNDSDASTLLVDTPTVNGKFVTQIIQGLTAGGRYRLTVTFVTNPNSRRAVPVIIECPS